jgi:SRSO17 transposase
MMDAGYGIDTALRETIAALGLDYIAGVQSHMTVCPAGEGPLPPAPWSGRARPPSRQPRDAGHRPIAIRPLAFGLPTEAWGTVACCEDATGRLSSRFARLRCGPHIATRGSKCPGRRNGCRSSGPKMRANRPITGSPPCPEVIAFDRLWTSPRLRWRIYRDYQELKQELGLGHYEGRGWRGFHHHATLCIAAYGFLISERVTIHPQEPAPPRGAKNTPSQGYRPRGTADPDRAARRQLGHNNASAVLGCHREGSTMSLLQRAPHANGQSAQLMTHAAEKGPLASAL